MGCLSTGSSRGSRWSPWGRSTYPPLSVPRANFRMEILTFEVVDFVGSYHMIFGRPCYAKFMAILNYTYLKLKIPRPHDVIKVSANHESVLLCDMGNYELAT